MMSPKRCYFRFLGEVTSVVQTWGKVLLLQQNRDKEKMLSGSALSVTDEGRFERDKYSRWRDVASHHLQRYASAKVKVSARPMIKKHKEWNILTAIAY